jgi:hypothetical protein
MEIFSIDYMRRWSNLILWKERTVTGGVRVYWYNDMHMISVVENGGKRALLHITDKWHGQNVLVGSFDSVDSALKFLEDLIGIPIRVVEVDYNVSSS